MVTLLASLTGFLTSLLPYCLKYVGDRQDKTHELAILDRQIEISKHRRGQRLQEIDTGYAMKEATALYRTFKTGISWVDAMNGTVRPVLAYGFFAIYVVIKWHQFAHLSPTVPLFMYAEYVWTEEDQALFAGIISFYYGQRTIAKMRK